MLSNRNLTVIFMTIMLHKHFVRFYFNLWVILGPREKPLQNVHANQSLQK